MPESAYTADQVREIVFLAAGAATGVLLQDHPDYEFPATRVSAAVERILSSYEVPR